MFLDPQLTTESKSGHEALAGHLDRAGEHLRADRLDLAEHEVDAALALGPADLRARNLRGLLWFRLGRLEEALGIYSELAAEFPDDAAVRLNLGLVELRMGRAAAAAADLRRVVDAEPENLRAQGYLGLALMRSDDLDGARQCFVRAGQLDMARQIEERLAHGSEAAMDARHALRSAASAGARILAHQQPFLPVEEAVADGEPRAEGAWQVRTPGAPSSWSGAGLPRVEVSTPLAAFAASAMLRSGPVGEPFAVRHGEHGAGASLLVRVDGRVMTRASGLVAQSGQLVLERAFRRVRGLRTEVPFGGDGDAMLIASGQGQMLMTSAQVRFFPVRLDDDILYVREAAVFAFEESLHWESGRVPGAREESPIVQFRGTGRVVLRAARAPVSLKVEPEVPAAIDPSALLGWIGRVLPRLVEAEGATPYVECTGEGALLIEEVGAPR